MGTGGYHKISFGTAGYALQSLHKGGAKHSIGPGSTQLQGIFLPVVHSDNRQAKELCQFYNSCCHMAAAADHELRYCTKPL